MAAGGLPRQAARAGGVWRAPHLAVRHKGDGLPLAAPGGQLEEARALGLHAVKQGRPRADAQALLHLQGRGARGQREAAAV